MINAAPDAPQPAKQHDYQAWYEEAMCASNEAGFVGLDAAQTIRELARQIAEAPQPTKPAEQEPVVVPPIDYDALIAAAYATNKKWAQGTDGCIAFKHGAEWFRQTLTAPEAPQPAKSAEQCWKCGDLDPAGHAKCNVPACGMREDTQPAKREPLTLREIDAIFTQVASTQEVYDMAAIRQSIARAIERAHGIGGQP